MTQFIRGKLQFARSWRAAQAACGSRAAGSQSSNGLAGRCPLDLSADYEGLASAYEPPIAAWDGNNKLSLATAAPTPGASSRGPPN